MKSIFSKTALRFFIIYPVLLLMAITMLAPPPSQAEVIIIVNSNLKVTQLDKKDVQDIFLGKKITWPDDKETEIKFVLISDADFHSEFVKDYTHKSTAQFKRYWNNMVFTGKGMMPKNIDSMEALIQYVSQTDGAIGYITPGEPMEGVEVLDVKE